MSTNEKKGVTVKIDADLHAEVRKYIEDHEMTMAEFVTLALKDELHQNIKNAPFLLTIAYVGDIIYNNLIG